MNYLGRVGSDTGIRTRVSAVRGQRPGPLDDIAGVGAAFAAVTYQIHFPMSFHVLQHFALGLFCGDYAKQRQC
jgi:hypothetical protein